MNEKKNKNLMQNYDVKEKKLEDDFNKTNINNNNKSIYVFFGYYNINAYNNKVPLYESNQNSGHIYYANLETQEIVAIDRNLKNEFESINKVIYFDDGSKYHDFRFYLDNFNKLRTEYFEKNVDIKEDNTAKQIIKKR